LKKVIVKCDGMNIGTKWVEKGTKLTLDDKVADVHIKSGAVEIETVAKTPEKKEK